MSFSISAIKKNAINAIFDRKNRVLLSAGVFWILTYGLMILYSGLSGYTTYATAVYNALLNSGYDAALSLNWPDTGTVAILLALVCMAMHLILAQGFRGYCLMALRGEEVKFRDIFNCFNFPVKILVIKLLQYFAVWLGSMCFVVPGILAYYSFRLAIYILYDHPEYSAIACLLESFRMMRGKRLSLFMLDLSMLGWFVAREIVALFIIPFVDIWVVPYRYTVLAGFYDHLVALENRPDDIASI